MIEPSPYECYICGRNVRTMVLDIDRHISHCIERLEREKDWRERHRVLNLLIPSFLVVFAFKRRQERAEQEHRTLLNLIKRVRRGDYQ